MAISTPALRAALAVNYGANAPWASLHTADPGATGANEVSTASGSPLYARRNPGWGSDGVGKVTGSVVFDVPAGTTVTHIGLWNTVTGGTWRDVIAIAPVSFPQQGTLALTLSYTQT